MKKLFLASLGWFSATLLVAPDGRAHGGQYRGPEDVVPPGGGRGGRGPGTGPGGPGGPHTGNPAGPAVPNPAGPRTGGGGPGGGGRGNPTTGGGGISLTDDLTAWDYWWEFNKDPYLRLKDAVWSNSSMTGSAGFWLGPRREAPSHDLLAPSHHDKLGTILPALKRAIDSTEQRDINSSCMIAMAKVGVDHPEYDLRDVFAARLARPDQEIRETAALALGIAGVADADSLALLTGLLRDDATGRAASGGREVNDRTRAFAGYGLGLLAAQTSALATKRQVFEVLRSQLQQEAESGRNLPVALLQGISLLGVAPDDDDGRALIAEALDCLRQYYDRDLGVASQLVQSHVPTAVARLLKDHPDQALVDEYKALFAAELAGKRGRARTSPDLARSCALALGQLCRQVDDVDADPDGAHVRLLLRTWREHKDTQTRNFSILALGQIGGDYCRSLLLKEFPGAGKSLEKPWVAMAMGVFAFEKFERGGSGSVGIEARFGEELHRELRAGGDPRAMSAFAVALGLIRYDRAADDMRALLARHRSKDDLAGYLCIGLALMRDLRAKEDIREIVASASRRPDLLKQAAIALGKLGDKTVADDLGKLLVDGDLVLAKLSAVAAALGFIGDRRTIEPLCRTLGDERLAPLSRAFAAVALGGVGDKEPLPWNSRISRDSNYRAAVETLTDGQAGILDIL